MYKGSLLFELVIYFFMNVLRLICLKSRYNELKVSVRVAYY